MKSIIEREATFKNNSDFICCLTAHQHYSSNTEKIIPSLCKIYTMKQGMLNSQLDLTSQTLRGVSPQSKYPCVRCLPNS